jgi:hypothetical protein
MTHDWMIFAFPAAVALVSGLFSGLLGRRFEEWLYRPRLKVEFFPSEGGFRTEGKWKTKEGTELVEIYIRARVSNTRSRVAKQCQPYLVKLEKVNPLDTTTYYDSLVLPWPKRDYVPRDIPKGVYHFFDVVGVFRNGRPGWRIKWQEQFTNLDDMSNHSGTYRFTVLVAGDGVKPDGRKIDVTYDGKDWHSLGAEDAGPFPPSWSILGRWRDRWRNR